MKNNLNSIKEYFNFLVVDYSYFIFQQKYSPEIMGNAVVIYKSVNIGVRVIVDRSQVFITIGSVTQSDRDWYDLIDIINYFAPQIEKIYEFPNNGPAEESINIQLAHLKNLILKNCTTLLEGDTASLLRIEEIQHKRINHLLNQLLDNKKTKRNG
jgi:hypothetical protein